MARGVSPTVRRRELGVLLRELRHAAGLTVDDVAGQLLCSPAKISRLETGQRGAALRDVRDLCGIYAVTNQAQVDRLMNLARESKQQTWWQEYDLTGATSTLIGLEASAASISDYQSSRLPGLLQTADYARAVLRGINPKWSAGIVEQRAEARLERQQLLTRPDAPRFWAVLDEAVLHRQVGGPDVMHAQLKRVIAASELPNATVQVLPYELGAHPGLDSTFILLKFDQPTVRDVVYVEGQVGELYLERSSDVARYGEIFDQLRAMALSPQASIQLVAKVARDYEG